MISEARLAYLISKLEEFEQYDSASDTITVISLANVLNWLNGYIDILEDNAIDKKVLIVVKPLAPIHAVRKTRLITYKDELRANIAYFVKTLGFELKDE